MQEKSWKCMWIVRWCAAFFPSCFNSQIILKESLMCSKSITSQFITPRGGNGFLPPQAFTHDIFYGVCVKTENLLLEIQEKDLKLNSWCKSHPWLIFDKISLRCDLKAIYLLKQLWIHVWWTDSRKMRVKHFSLILWLSNNLISHLQVSIF